MESIAVSWSGGKDSAIALYDIIKQNKYNPVVLITFVNSETMQVKAHKVNLELIAEQAKQMGIDLKYAAVSERSTNKEYEAALLSLLKEAKESYGITKVAYGDIFLEDIRKYREEIHGKLDVQPIFPNWGKETTELAFHILDSGIRAKLCAVDTERLDASFCGAEYDRDFVRSLPNNVDPCGERGEFHTFVYDFPLFRERINLRVERKRVEERYCYVELKLR